MGNIGPVCPSVKLIYNTENTIQSNTERLLPRNPVSVYCVKTRRQSGPFGVILMKSIEQKETFCDCLLYNQFRTASDQWHSFSETPGG